MSGDVLFEKRWMMTPLNSREMAYCGLFGAAALLLPVLFHMMHLGPVFMPMYLPLVALAFFVPPQASALTALIIPLLSGAVTGMPPFFPPVAPVMSLELTFMALLIGLFRGVFPSVPVWIALTLTLASGRVVSLAGWYVVAKTMALPASFVAGFSMLSGWPGLLLMMAVIPRLVRLRAPFPAITKRRKPHET